MIKVYGCLASWHNEQFFNGYIEKSCYDSGQDGKPDRDGREQGMTRSEQRFQKAIKMLMEEYRKAQAYVWVEKPLSFALYQVWKYFDIHEKSRLREKSGGGDAE